MEGLTGFGVVGGWHEGAAGRARRGFKESAQWTQISPRIGSFQRSW